MTDYIRWMDDLEIGGSEAEGGGGRKAMERGQENRGDGDERRE